MTLTKLEKATFVSFGGALIMGLVIIFLQYGAIVRKNEKIGEEIQGIQALTPKTVLEKTEKLAGSLDDAQKINVNFASVELIDSIPGMGKTTAERIVEFVKSKGKIESLSELSTLQGMTPKKLSNLNLYLCVSGGITSATEQKKLNLNFATEAEIEKLPGVGPSLAKSIIETRNSKGSFQSLDDLQEVPGLSEKTFRKFENFVDVR